MVVAIIQRSTLNTEVGKGSRATVVGPGLAVSEGQGSSENCGRAKARTTKGSALVSKEDCVNIRKPGTSRWPQGSELGDVGRRPGGSSLLSLTDLVPGMTLYRDREGFLVEYSTMWGIPCASDGPGKSKGESSRGPERTHNRIRSPRCVASSV